MIEHEIVVDGKKTKVRIRTQGTSTMNGKPPMTLGERLRAAKRLVELEEGKKDGNV